MENFDILSLLQQNQQKDASQPKKKCRKLDENTIPEFDME